MLDTLKVQERMAFGQQEDISLFESELSSIKELDFAFNRAASRLTEMSSKEYLQKWNHHIKLN